jgi:DNA-binding NarL/FixJ family response regulator
VTLRVLLVDDMAEVRVLLRTGLRLHGRVEVVGEAGTGRAAVELAERTKPDVVVLDLALPDRSGQEIFPELQGSSPRSRFVIYSVRDSQRSWFEERGASFVVKTADGTNLHEVLAAVAQHLPPG